ncbi:MAG: transketolase [archaeon]
MDFSETDLIERAKELRKKVLDLALETGEGHIGGSLSEIEIMISLYDFILKEEDKFILSKGHACFPFYILLNEKGYKPKILGHPDIDCENGIYCTTGSLGHGLPIGVGMALARKLKSESGKIYVLMGDGECQEGTTWESSLIASHHKLDNLVIIIDDNKLQAINKTQNVLSFNSLRKKFEAFGFYVSEADGHNFKELIEVLNKKVSSMPHLIIAHTTKGKGVSYMENNPDWHGRRPTPERINPAYEELK